jgi:rSAM/selenodomain-associated transferase 2
MKIATPIQDYHRRDASSDVQTTSARHTETQISIIVPVYNEAAVIRDFLRGLRVRAPEAEIIVVDGGSRDGTRELAADFCDQLITSGRGRATQMNTGARVAHGEILWFVHADVEVPAQCLSQISHALTDPGVVGGFFRIRLPRPQFVYRLTDSFAHYAGILLRMRCGDHGLFCRRSAFIDVGGYRDVLIMEDVEFFRALRRSGKVRRLKEFLTVSARRYEEVGPLRLSLWYGLIAALYAIGVPSPALASIYSRMCQRRR